MRIHEGKIVGDLPPKTPDVYTPNPEDHWTPGTVAWAIILTAGAITQTYGILRDAKDPLNRGKWTLTSNVRPVGGFDSVTGLPLDVRFGAMRRSLLILAIWGTAAWCDHHWTSPRGRY